MQPVRFFDLRPGAGVHLERMDVAPHRRCDQEIYVIRKYMH
jgi:hypothetical protein